MRVIFFGSSDFSIPFLEAINNSRHDIILVVTGIEKKAGRGKKVNPNPVKIAANSLNISTLEVDNFNDELIKRIIEKEFDCFVLVSFGKILPEKLIDISMGKTFNFHPSILPKYRGPSPIISALLNGEQKTGISIIKIAKGIDDGDVYLTTEFAISEEDNKDTLEEKIIYIGAPLLIKVLDLFEENKITTFPQGKENITYTSFFKKIDLKINWNNNATAIRNQVRAFSLKPGCFAIWKGKSIKILKVNICKDSNISILLKDEFINGTVISADKLGLFVKCGAKLENNKFLNGQILKIELLKPQDKNIITALDFINGYRVKPGDIFE